MPESESPAIDTAAIAERVREGLEQLGASTPSVGLEPTPTPTGAPPSTQSTAQKQLVQLVVLLSRWAARMNLTGHRDPLDMTTRLVLDAAALGAAIPELANSSDLADLGSGAGFPGLPIAILHPNLRVLLVESRQRRHHFQREARRQLGLSLVTPILGRSDEVEASACDVVVAQAMASPERAIESMSAWTREGGLIVLPASDRAEPPKLADDLEIERRTYRVPLTAIERQVWLIRRRSIGLLRPR